MMPIYDHLCVACCVVTEELVPSEQPSIKCPECGAEAIRLVSAPARTATRWGDSQSYFDRGLGCEIRNHSHREQVMKAKGLVPLSDYATGTVENAVHHQLEDKKAHEKTVAIYKDNLKRHGGDAAAAVAATFPSRT